MICDKCKGAIGFRLTEKAKARVKGLKYFNLGYSNKDIAELVRKEGHKMSATSVARILKSIG